MSRCAVADALEACVGVSPCRARTGEPTETAEVYGGGGEETCRGDMGGRWFEARRESTLADDRSSASLPRREIEGLEEARIDGGGVYGEDVDRAGDTGSRSMMRDACAASGDGCCCCC